MKKKMQRVLSFFLTIIMLVSTMSVGFFGITAIAATAAEIQAFESYVGAASGDATIETTSGKYFADDSDTHTGNASTLYKNVIYSGNAQSVASVGATNIRDDGALESFAVYYPATVLMYDGTTTPQFGISIRKDAKDKCEVRHWGTSLSGTNLYLVNGSWYGAPEGSNNGKFFDAYYGGNQLCGYNYTGTASESNFYGGDKGGWQWYANLVAYNGTMSDTTYTTSITPSFKTYVGQPDTAWFSDNSKNVEVNLGNASVPVYVINTKVWKAAVESAISMYKTLSANEAAYTAATISSFKAIAKELLDANPNTINWASNVASGVSTYNSKVSAALAKWNAFTPVKNCYVTWKNWDGTVLASGYVEPGSTPSYSGATPVRSADDKYIYTFANWSPAVGAVNSDTTYTAQYNKTGNDGKVLFDNLIDFSEWDLTNANNATIIPVGDTGFALTSNDGVGEGTTSSPYFPVTPGKSYYVDIDIMGSNWDVYFFFCDANGSWVDFSDSTNRFSANGSGVTSRTFTAPAGSVKAQIRVDANGAATVTQVNSVRVFDASLGDKTLSVHPSQTVKYEAAYNTYASLPTPTRTAYNFAGWVLADGTAVNNDTIVKDAPVHTLFSKWTPVTYTMTVNVNGGNAVASKQFNIESGTMPATPTRTAYDFVNWEVVSGDGNWTVGDTYNAGADISGKYGNVTVKANWAPTVYTITLDENGGNAVADTTYTTEGGVIPAAPVREGYTFSYWEVVSDSGSWKAGDKFNPGFNFAGKNGNLTLKAVWNTNTYVLNFNLNAPAGAITEPACDKVSVDVTFDNAIGTLPVPTLDGYTFAGWYTLASGGTQVNASTVYTTASDTTIYATWTPETYTIIIDEDFGVAVPDGSYNIEAGVAPEATTRTGYTFSCWKVKESVGNWAAGSTINPGDSLVGKYGNVTLVAVWTANKYTVNFELNDDTGVADATADKTTIQATYDSYIDANETLPVATRPGYNFLGWYTQAEGGEKIDESLIYTVEGESTFYAHWELVTYTVSFDVRNGTAIAPITYTIEDKLVLPDAVRQGYEFVTWRFLQASTGSWVRNTTYKGDLGNLNWGNVTLTADYKIVTYTITWDINGEIETSEHEFNTYPTHADPAVTTDPYYEYKFIGWTPDIDRVTGPATYTAVFEKSPKSYEIKWVDEDGDVIHSGLLGYGETIPTDVVTAPVKEGYTVAWDYSGNVTMPAQNIVVKPVYTPIKYKITWNVEGTEIHSDMVDYDSLPVYSGTTPVKAADSKYTYTFSGWTPELSVVKGEATYEATFDKTPNSYTIYWYAEDNSLVASHVLAYGSAITNIPKVPEKVGSVGSWANVPETMPDHDVEIRPVYVKGALVTWYLDGTSTGAYYQQGFENGTQIEYNRSNPEKAADAQYTYKFEGWSLTPDGDLISGYPVAGSTDIVYYAVYSKTPNEYTITWKADGNVVLEETLAYGSDVKNVPAVPAKKGHTGKWGTFPSTMPSTNVTVEAVYTPNDYTITWVVGENVYPTLFTYGTMPKFTGITSKPSTATTDFTFTGWDKDITLVEGDTTYTAQYAESARKYTVTWQYENGAVIDTDTVENGAAITFIPVIAEKEGHDAKYVIPDVMPTKNITIVVTYEAKSYTVTWSTPSGVIEETWKYGETPVYDTEKYGVPEKAATPEKQYTFLTWSPTVSSVRGDTTYTAIFSETARKYTVVWYVDGEFYETRDIAYGSVIPTLPVPAKDGYVGNWDSSYRTMPAKDLTINAEYTARKYTVYWKVEGLTVYSASVSYGDMIPAQKVPDKLGYTGAWLNVPEKMPAQNITITAEYKANEYNVTWRVNGVDNNDIAQYGKDYVITFTGETIPEDVRITVGGANLAVENYTYNLETGVLTIKGSAILGDIFVTAKALGGKLDIVINSINASLSNQNTTINERQAYHTSIIPEKGYLLPDFVEIYVDGRLLTDGYVYDASTGKLTINAEVIVGSVEITFDCPPDPDYDPSAPEENTPSCSCNCHSKNAFIKFFFDLATFLRKLFGMEEHRYCACGAAHW